MPVILKNATYVDFKTLEFKKGHIEILEGKNSGIKFHTYFPFDSDAEILDCEGKLVTKSFAVGHHHVYSALARGMGAPKKKSCKF